MPNVPSELNISSPKLVATENMLRSKVNNHRSNNNTSVNMLQPEKSAVSDFLGNWKQVGIKCSSY